MHGYRLTVPQRAVMVDGTSQRFAPGQHLTLTACVDGHVFRRIYSDGPARCWPGHFSATLRVPRAGHVSVTVAHAGSSKLSTFSGGTGFSVFDSDLGLGTTGRMVQLVQQQLKLLHLYIPQTGIYDEGTELAVDAYHRLLGKGEGHTSLDPATMTDLLDGRGSFHVRYPSQGQHAEGDLSDQVLAFTNGGSVALLFPISSGKPSTPTVLGNYQVYRKQPGYLPDGMYFSSFFTGGYAIHGYDPAPDYPASHGCMRLPIVDAVPAYDWIQMGDWVDTYYT